MDFDEIRHIIQAGPGRRTGLTIAAQNSRNRIENLIMMVADGNQPPVPNRPLTLPRSVTTDSLEDDGRP
jgi:hypothetical protein